MVILTYIATFYTHFGAVSCARALKETDMHPLFMPVPRKLSSSCGTCVKFNLDSDPVAYAQEMNFDDLDTIYLDSEGDYSVIYETARK